MEYFKKIAAVLVVTELAGVGFLAIWGYGKKKYHEGRIDACSEIHEELEKLKEALKEKGES